MITDWVYAATLPLTAGSKVADRHQAAMLGL
jgi:hypothetical protein